jgi:hypothetical protein
MRGGDAAIRCRLLQLSGDLVEPFGRQFACICHICSIRTAAGMTVHSSGNTK